jgi:glucosamine--fructose-6-phosphate aminotransferase (isomerizing)
MAAIKLAKEKGAFVYGICNVVDSSIARYTDAGSYTMLGRKSVLLPQKLLQPN